MISPHTVPGTKVVCIDTEGRGPWSWEYGTLPLVIGKTYTVLEIVRTDKAPDLGIMSESFGVHLEGMTPPVFRVGDYSMRVFYQLEWFRQLELPRCLIDILHSAPVKSSEREPSFSHVGTCVKGALASPPVNLAAPSGAVFSHRSLNRSTSVSAARPILVHSVSSRVSVSS